MMVHRYVAKQSMGMPFIINKSLQGSMLYLCMDPQQCTVSLFDDSTNQTESALGFNIPAFSYRGLERPPEVCDPQLHLSASELIKTKPQATLMTGSY